MRKSLSVAVCLAAALGGASPIAAQSLADVARAEAARRKALGSASAKTYTNDDLRTGNGASSPSPDPATIKPAVPLPAPVATTEPPKPQPPAAPGPLKDEKYWRDRITAARMALERSKAFLDALQSHINGLYAEFVAMGDPVQRALIEKKRFEAIAEQDRVKADVAQQTKAIAAIEDEARRASVPAGWLR